MATKKPLPAASPAALKAAQALTPEEQRLIAECMQAIYDLDDPEQQMAIIQQMLPPELMAKVQQLMGSLGTQGFKP